MKPERRSFYRDNLKRLYQKLIPKGVKTLFLSGSKIPKKGLFDYVVVDDYISYENDVQSYFESVKKILKPGGRVIISYYNHLWEPIVEVVTWLGWRAEPRKQSWLNTADISNLLYLAGFEVITTQRQLLLPVDLGEISEFVNKWIAHLPIINNFCLSTYTVARPIEMRRQEFSVSVVVPARNESENLKRLIPVFPKFGKSQEIIFVEGHSKDDTWNVVKDVAKKYNGKDGLKVKAMRQKGIGKADAVRTGFSEATGEVLMILDADLTVDPTELPKFYDALADGKGEFINGCRLVYPMEKEAMRVLNIFGNQVFSWLFTWILGQRFKDTLCGTKVILRKDYDKIVANRSFFGDFDPFGDFDLIFGAVKQNLKVVELPVRYKERTYGSTNISRFVHGWLLLRMTVFAFRKFKF